MPIIKSAKKRVKQAEKGRQRNYPVRTLMKTYIKKVLHAVKEGNKEEAEKLLKQAYKVIDTAAKKNIIHDKNAARKKSRLARNLANIEEKKAVKAPKETKAAPKKKTAAKKK